MKEHIGFPRAESTVRSGHFRQIGDEGFVPEAQTACDVVHDLALTWFATPHRHRPGGESGVGQSLRQCDAKGAGDVGPHLLFPGEVIQSDQDRHLRARHPHRFGDDLRHMRFAYVTQGRPLR
ncbi:hypothetical protein [Nocardia cyriacigeorgica]|uniref:hypothetical protein n=1 Tax=Nocardia cyriacigeorgica TaxID=135487 RepID=UPI00201221AC|nr:hypothetical protein [Nocardia cyriacigeorgica]